MSRPEQVDVVIVGSGAGGAPVAYTLAKAGAQVLVLEKGPRYTTQDFLHDELKMCRRDMFVPYPEDDPHVIRADLDDPGYTTNAAWTSRCVGGGTVHMSGFFLRMHPKDFSLKSSYGPFFDTTVQDWPIDYATLRPYYTKVERLVGVSGRRRSDPFAPPGAGEAFEPPLATHPVGGWIDDAAAKLGLHPFQMPRAILSRPRPGRGACIYTGLCGSYGCVTNARGSTLASLLPLAEATGRCTVRPKAMVQEILMQNNNAARGVVYVDEAGRRHQVDAKVVVVAASAIESARLLLSSGSSIHPLGLGNSGRQVGKNLCFSTLTQLKAELPRAGLDPARLAELDNPAPFIGRVFQDAYELPREGDVFGRGGTFHLLWEHPNPIHAAEQLLQAEGDQLRYGPALMEAMKAHFTASRTIEVEGFSEWLPTEQTYVDLDPSYTDRWGMPAARITMGPRHPSDRAASVQLARRAEAVLQQLGAKNIRTEVVGGTTYVLQGGTCRMGTDPSTSVTTGAGNIHGVPNVYVSGGGSLPTSGGVPTTMTIMANAFRIADWILRRNKLGAASST